MQTSPPRIPLHIYPTSYKGFSLENLEVIKRTIIPPEEAAIIVFTATNDATFTFPPDIERDEPALNPNHPNHKIKVPITESGTL